MKRYSLRGIVSLGMLLSAPLMTAMEKNEELSVSETGKYILSVEQIQKLTLIFHADDVEQLKEFIKTDVPDLSSNINLILVVPGAGSLSGEGTLLGLSTGSFFVSKVQKYLLDRGGVDPNIFYKDRLDREVTPLVRLLFTYANTARFYSAYISLPMINGQPRDILKELMACKEIVSRMLFLGADPTIMTKNVQNLTLFQEFGKPHYELKRDVNALDVAIRLPVINKEVEKITVDIIKEILKYGGHLSEDTTISNAKIFAVLQAHSKEVDNYFARKLAFRRKDQTLEIVPPEISDQISRYYESDQLLPIGVERIELYQKELKDNYKEKPRFIPSEELKKQLNQPKGMGDKFKEFFGGYEG